MERNTLVLFTSAIFGAVSVFFGIIGVAAPGWPRGYYLLRCGTKCSEYNVTTGALLIIGIIFLCVAVLTIILFALGQLNNATNLIKFAPLVFLFVAIVFITAGYSHLIGYSTYGYHLSVVASVSAILSAVSFAYWAGH